jgi:hypothetical protein
VGAVISLDQDVRHHMGGTTQPAVSSGYGSLMAVFTPRLMYHCPSEERIDSIESILFSKQGQKVADLNIMTILDFVSG